MPKTFAAPPKRMKNVLAEAIPATELLVSSSYIIKGSLMGPSGSGKTQSAITLPLIEGKPILLLDFDGRAETVAGEKDVTVLRLADPDPASPIAWDKADSLRKELWALARTGSFPYSGIIEDGLTSMAQYAMNSALLTDSKRGLGGGPAYQHYNPQIHYLKTHIRSMKSLPCHYILTAHIDMVTDESSGMVKMVPKVTRSLRTEIPGWFNETYRCYAEGVKTDTHYFWKTTGVGVYDFFKSTLNNKGRFWEDPIRINFNEKLVGFNHLIGLRFKGESK